MHTMKVINNIKRKIHRNYNTLKTLLSEYVIYSFMKDSAVDINYIREQKP